MSGVATAIAGAAVVGAGASYFGGQQAAAGAQGAANLQANAASAARNQELQFGQQQGAISMNLAQATPQELNALGQSYQVASSNLQQQQQLMNSIDPSLMEASKQALAIMQGGTAASTQPMFALRNQQRAQLVQSLQAQYGPGAESTAIGQQRLNQFDMETQGMQTSALGGLMGIASNSGPQANLLAANNQMQQVGQGYSAIQNRMLTTQQQNSAMTLGAMANSAPAVINSAGAPYVGQTLQGQGMASLGNNVMQGGTQLGMAYYGRQQNNQIAGNAYGMGPAYGGGAASGGGGVSNGYGTAGSNFDVDPGAIS